mgnify:CR=1 FL=1
MSSGLDAVNFGSSCRRLPAAELVRDDLVLLEANPLQDIANALWSAGAEAVAINGQRLTATSTIRAAGGAILVGFRPVTGPYEVSAIGPAEMDQIGRAHV